MKHHMTSRGCEVAAILWICIALFAARVVGQFEAFIVAPAWLPGMDAWYSGLLPYYLLLPAQIALLMVMAVVAWNRRVRTGRFAAASPRFSRGLRIFAGLYFTLMAVRLGADLFRHGADFWEQGAIPVAFHWVLALFVLVSGRASELLLGDVRIPAENREQYDEADDIPHGDVPAVTQPLAYGLGLGKEVRYGDAR
jgi:hypothetical protein